MSTYSPSLRVELITSGDQAGQWGNTTNDNFAYIFDAAIAGYVDVTTSVLDHVLTYNNGPVSDENLNQSIQASLRLDTSTGAAFNVFAPPVSKQYVIWNNSSSHAATIYNSSGLGNTTISGPGVTIAAGAKVLVFSTGAGFYEIQASNVTGIVATANGGTGLSSFTANGVVYASSTSALATSSALQFNGANLTVSGDFTVNGNKLVMGSGAIQEHQTSVTASNIDLVTGNCFTKTISGATTFTVSNVPPSGTVASFILDITNGGSATVNWWSGVKWPYGTAPSLTVSGRDSLGFYTYDGGTTWTGLLLGKDIK